MTPRRQGLAQHGLPQPLRAHPLGADPDGDGPGPLAHRLGGVDDQVQHHLLQPGRAPSHRGEARRGLHRQLEPVRQGGAEELGHVPHQAPEVDRLRGAGRTASVSQHLLAEAGRGPCGRLDVGQAGASGDLRGRLRPQDHHVAQDGGEQVVEVMGDPARQDAQALQPLGLLHLPLQLAPLLLAPLQVGHVQREAAEAGGAVHPRDDELVAGPAPPAELLLEARRAAAAQDLEVVLRHLGGEGLREALGVGAAHQRLRVQPQVGAEALVGEDHRGVRLLDVGQPGEVAHEGAEHLLAGPQRDLGALALGDLPAQVRVGLRELGGARHHPLLQLLPHLLQFPLGPLGPREEQREGLPLPEPEPASLLGDAPVVLGLAPGGLQRLDRVDRRAAHGPRSPTRSRTPVQSSPRLAPWIGATSTPE